MRIALSNPDVNLTGGVERVITEAANHLIKRGHDVTVYASRVDQAPLDPRVRIRRITVPGGLDARTGLGFRRRCAAAIVADRPDVHGSFSTLSPLGGVFWVPSVHRVGYESLLSRRGFAGRLGVRLNPYHRVRLRLERSMFDSEGCTLVLAQTEAVRTEIRRCYGRVAEIGLLPLGYADSTFDPDHRVRQRAIARKQFGYSSEDQVLLFAANELERKGFEVLLRAVSQVPEVKILGAGRETPKPRTVERFNLRGRLQWAGQVKDMAMLHAAADALVLPTRYEPWGLVIVEALGSGLPVVTSRLAGAAAAVRDGETGKLLDDPEDEDELAAAIRWAVLSKSPAPARDISDSVRAFTWERVIARYEQALSDIANTG